MCKAIGCLIFIQSEKKKNNCDLFFLFSGVGPAGVGFTPWIRQIQRRVPHY